MRIATLFFLRLPEEARAIHCSFLPVASSSRQTQAFSQTTQATRYDVILGVNRAYYGVLQAQALVRLADETVKTRQTLADQITALTNAQLKSQVDLGFAQVNSSEARLLPIRAQDNLKRFYADLGRALGRDTPSEEYQERYLYRHRDIRTGCIQFVVRVR
jgi:outer membrane protein TolC